MHVFVRRTAAGLLAVVLALLLSPFLPNYWAVYIFHTAILLLTAGVLAGSAFRQRLDVFDPVVRYVSAGFAAAVAVSFFMTPLHKYDVTSDSLSRVLWIGLMGVSFLICAGDILLRRILGTLAAVGLLFLAWRTFRIDSGEPVRLMVSAGVGILMFGVGWIHKPSESRPGPARILGISTLAGLVLIAAWAGLTRARLSGPEVELVRKAKQTENAVISVAKRCFKERWLIGTGSGSIRRKFLQYRPAEATLQGVPDRLEIPIQSIAVLAAETGALGIGTLGVLILCPFVIRSHSHPRPDWAALAAVQGMIVAHELLGGGWLLTPAGSAILFCGAGLMLARDDPDEWESVPASFYIASLTVLGGIFILQQIHGQRTLEAEKLMVESRALIDAGQLNEALNKVDYGLTMVDGRRNELLSIAIGGFNRAGMIDQSLKNSLLLLSRDPDYPSVKNNIGAFYVGLNRLQDALPYVKETAEKHPTTENLAKLGHIYASTGNPPAALKSFSEAVMLFPREVDLFLARAATLPDSAAQGKVIIEHAAFSTNALLNHTDPASRQPMVQFYRGHSSRMKKGLGLPES